MNENARNQTEVVIHLKDTEQASEDIEALHRVLERRCEGLSGEFPETSLLEVRVTATGNDPDEFECHARATGKSIDLAAQASAPDPRIAADRALDRLERELRRRHDKRIFQQRRSARRTAQKQRAAG